MSSKKLLSALLILPSAAMAQGVGEDRSSFGESRSANEVIVRGERSIEERFSATGSRVTITRGDIEAMAADTVVDVLKQLPGVQVTGGGGASPEIRMRGMDRGATQILVDGERVSGGRRSGQLPFDQLPSEMIERIEVLRAPSAEFSGATGGTINIVLRQSQISRETFMRMSIQNAFDRNGPSLWVHTTGPLNADAAKPVDLKKPTPANAEGATANPKGANAAAPADTAKPAEPANHDGRRPWTYFLGFGAGERLPGSDMVRDTSYTGPETWSTQTRETTRGVVREAMLLPRLNGRPTGRDTVALRGTLMGSQSTGRFDSVTTGAAADGSFRGGQAHDSSDGERQMANLRAEWTRLFDTTKLEVRGSAEAAHESYAKYRDANVVVGSTSTSSFQSFSDDRRDRALQAAAKLMSTEGTHVWMGGAEFERRQLDVTNVTAGTGLTAGEKKYDASIQRLVLWGQNEWTIAKKSTLTAGLRVESITRETSYDGVSLSDHRTQLQPSLHSRTALSDTLQLRLNLARTTKLPMVTDMIERVTPSVGSNSPTRPDTVGNAGLKPETTLSFDVGFEARLPNRGQAGINLFVRSVDELIVRRTAQVAGRWLQRPENIGKAMMWGVETDLKTPLAGLGIPGGWNLNATASLLQSRIDARDSGIDGRIPGQAHYLLNINVAKPMPRTTGFFGGATLNLQGASDIGNTSSTSGREHATATVEVFTGQLIQGLGFWRLSLSNLTNVKKNRERIDIDALGGVRSERSWERSDRRIFLMFGTRW